MTSREIILFVSYCAPIISPLVCCLLVLFSFRKLSGNVQRKAGRLMIGAYTTAALFWTGIVLYITNYNAFTLYNTLFFLFALLNQVFLYHFMFTLTGTGEKDKFNPLHYIVPLIISVTLGMWSLFVPVEAQYFIVESGESNAPGHFVYSLLFNTPLLLFCLYNVFYSIKTLKRISLYKKAVSDYSSDDSRTSLQWLYIYLILIWITIPLSLAAWCTNMDILFTSVFGIVEAFAIISQYVIICYNLITGNFVIILSENKEKQQGRTKKNREAKCSGPIEIKQLERFMREHKPYLDPSLKITDLTAMLHTNRTSLSAFINTTYRMNFSTYINNLRMKELETIRKTVSKGKVAETELVCMAGFANYRNYLRQIQNNQQP